MFKNEFWQYFPLNITCFLRTFLSDIPFCHCAHFAKLFQLLLCCSFNCVFWISCSSFTLIYQFTSICDSLLPLSSFLSKNTYYLHILHVVFKTRLCYICIFTNHKVARGHCSKENRIFIFLITLLYTRRMRLYLVKKRCVNSQPTLMIMFFIALYLDQPCSLSLQTPCIYSIFLISFLYLPCY